MAASAPHSHSGIQTPASSGSSRDLESSTAPLIPAFSQQVREDRAHGGQREVLEVRPEVPYTSPTPLHGAEFSYTIHLTLGKLGNSSALHPGGKEHG